MKAERRRKNQLADLGSDAADAKLHDDVSAFASQLGFTSEIQNGFNDSDFRPEIATQQIGKNGMLLSYAGAGTGKFCNSKVRFLGLQSN